MHLLLSSVDRWQRFLLWFPFHDGVWSNACRSSDRFVQRWPACINIFLWLVRPPRTPFVKQPLIDQRFTLTHQGFWACPQQWTASPDRAFPTPRSALKAFWLLSNVHDVSTSYYIWSAEQINYQLSNNVIARPITAQARTTRKCKLWT